MSSYLPTIPKAWFVLGESKKFVKGPYAYTLKGKKFVVYRNDNGELIVQNARCPHMGVDLSKSSKIKKGCIECPLHGWRFDSKGDLDFIPGGKPEDLPQKMNLNTYPVVERDGIAYMFNSLNEEYPLPFFEGESIENFKRSRIVQIHQPGSWYGPLVNVFDINHFIYSHNRKPFQESEYDFSDPVRAKVIHYYEVIPTLWFEKVLSKFIGRKIILTAEIYSASQILFKSQVGGFASYMMAHCTPAKDGKGRTDMMVYVKKGKTLKEKLRNFLTLRIQPLLIKYIFQTESDELEDLILNEKNLHPESDIGVLKFINWLKLNRSV